MCGLAGLVGSVASSTDLDRMLTSITHRGPDGRGVLERPGLAAGMVRLAIIDVQYGDQPKWSQCGEWSVLFNGEIYNHRRIRAELSGLGYAFTTQSDTEVIANALAEWGLDAIGRMDGMFALAAWNERQRKLHLARDRLGEKPLFVRTLQDGLAFASEVKALRAHRVLGVPDSVGIEAYLRWGYIPSPISAWEDVRKVEPGEVVTVDDSGSITARWRYWSLPAVGAAAAQTATVKDLEERLRPAVQRTLISDVEIAVLLSGGIDSSLTAWFASGQARSLRAFTVRFADRDKDESVHALAVGKTLGLDVEVLDVSPDDALRTVRTLPRTFDEPFADQSAMPTLLLCEAVGKHVKVALGGDGGDELFSGYTMYAQAERLRRMAAFVPGFLAHAGERLSVSPRAMPSRIGNRSALLAHGKDSALDGVRSVTTPSVRALLLGGGTRRTDDLVAGTPSEDRRADLSAYFPDDILVKVDRTSMSAGLEIRTPWLDPALIEWALSLDSGSLGPPGSKSLPRALAAKRFGPELATRPKQGFSVPLPAWLRGPLAPLVDEYLAPDAVAAAGLVSQEGVDLLLARLRAGRDSAARAVWALLVLQLWGLDADH